MSLCLDGEWMDAARGSYAVIAGGIAHDFENRGADECGFLTVNVPDGFEQDMLELVKWLAQILPGER